MRVARKKNLKEIRARARHHAKRLEKVTKMMADIFSNGVGVMALKSRIRIYTKTGSTYIIRGYSKKGFGYVGIEIKEFGKDNVVRLRVEE